MAALKVFNKWEISGLTVNDPGLVKYISLEPKIVPKTGARYASQRFHKSKIFILERLMNKLMVAGHKGKKHKVSSGRNTGKANQIYNLVKEALEIIEQRTKKNPIEVFLRALENAAPREEIITIEYGGARYPKSVEISPQRRIDLALRYMAQGAYHSSFNRKKESVYALVEEILAAYNIDSSSNAISKKFELERQADSSK
ncbi:30S ribosomal protein S7 [Candidatus Woesearchaeota archaeon]|nr:30S ribosomal protein S7 [Candidatus Woesearchaeota archaeon]